MRAKHFVIFLGLFLTCLLLVMLDYHINHHKNEANRSENEVQECLNRISDIYKNIVQSSRRHKINSFSDNKEDNAFWKRLPKDVTEWMKDRCRKQPEYLHLNRRAVNYDEISNHSDSTAVLATHLLGFPNVSLNMTTSTSLTQNETTRSTSKKAETTSHILINAILNTKSTSELFSLMTKSTPLKYSEGLSETVLQTNSSIQNSAINEVNQAKTIPISPSIISSSTSLVNHSAVRLVSIFNTSISIATCNKTTVTDSDLTMHTTVTKMTNTHLNISTIPTMSASFNSGVSESVLPTMKINIAESSTTRNLSSNRVTSKTSIISKESSLSSTITAVVIDSKIPTQVKSSSVIQINSIDSLNRTIIKPISVSIESSTSFIPPNASFLFSNESNRSFETLQTFMTSTSLRNTSLIIINKSIKNYTKATWFTASTLDTLDTISIGSSISLNANLLTYSTRSTLDSKFISITKSLLLTNFKNSSRSVNNFIVDYKSSALPVASFSDVGQNSSLYSKYTTNTFNTTKMIYNSTQTFNETPFTSQNYSSLPVSDTTAITNASVYRISTHLPKTLSVSDTTPITNASVYRISTHLPKTLSVSDTTPITNASVYRISTHLPKTLSVSDTTPITNASVYRISTHLPKTLSVSDTTPITNASVYGISTHLPKTLSVNKNKTLIESVFFSATTLLQPQSASSNLSTSSTTKNVSHSFVTSKITIVDSTLLTSKSQLIVFSQSTSNSLNVIDTNSAFSANSSVISNMTTIKPSKTTLVTLTAVAQSSQNVSMINGSFMQTESENGGSTLSVNRKNNSIYTTTKLSSVTIANFSLFTPESTMVIISDNVLIVSPSKTLPVLLMTKTTSFSSNLVTNFSDFTTNKRRSSLFSASASNSLSSVNASSFFLSQSIRTLHSKISNLKEYPSSIAHKHSSIAISTTVMDFYITHRSSRHSIELAMTSTPSLESMYRIETVNSFSKTPRPDVTEATRARVLAGNKTTILTSSFKEIFSASLSSLVTYNNRSITKETDILLVDTTALNISRVHLKTSLSTSNTIVITSTQSRMSNLISSLTEYVKRTLESVFSNSLNGAYDTLSTPAPTLPFTQLSYSTSSRHVQTQSIISSQQISVSSLMETLKFSAFAKNKSVIVDSNKAITEVTDQTLTILGSFSRIMASRSSSSFQLNVSTINNSSTRTMSLSKNTLTTVTPRDFSSIDLIDSSRAYAGSTLQVNTTNIFNSTIVKYFSTPIVNASSITVVPSSNSSYILKHSLNESVGGLNSTPIESKETYKMFESKSDSNLFISGSSILVDSGNAYSSTLVGSQQTSISFSSAMVLPLVSSFKFSSTILMNIFSTKQTTLSVKPSIFNTSSAFTKTSLLANENCSSINTQNITTLSLRAYTYSSQQISSTNTLDVSLIAIPTILSSVPYVNISSSEMIRSNSSLHIQTTSMHATQKTLSSIFVISNLSTFSADITKIGVSYVIPNSSLVSEILLTALSENFFSTSPTTNISTYQYISRTLSSRSAIISQSSLLAHKNVSTTGVDSDFKNINSTVAATIASIARTQINTRNTFSTTFIKPSNDSTFTLSPRASFSFRNVTWTFTASLNSFVNSLQIATNSTSTFFKSLPQINSIVSTRSVSDIVTTTVSFVNSLSSVQTDSSYSFDRTVIKSQATIQVGSNTTIQQSTFISFVNMSFSSVPSMINISKHTLKTLVETSISPSFNFSSFNENSIISIGLTTSLSNKTDSKISSLVWSSNNTVSSTFSSLIEVTSSKIGKTFILSPSQVKPIGSSIVVMSSFRYQSINTSIISSSNFTTIRNTTSTSFSTTLKPGVGDNSFRIGATSSISSLYKNFATLLSETKLLTSENPKVSSILSVIISSLFSINKTLTSSKGLSSMIELSSYNKVSTINSTSVSSGLDTFSGSLMTHTLITPQATSSVFPNESSQVTYSPCILCSNLVKSASVFIGLPTLNLYSSFHTQKVVINTAKTTRLSVGPTVNSGIIFNKKTTLIEASPISGTGIPAETSTYSTISQNTFTITSLFGVQSIADKSTVVKLNSFPAYSSIPYSSHSVTLNASSARAIHTFLSPISNNTNTLVIRGGNNTTRIYTIKSKDTFIKTTLATTSALDTVLNSDIVPNVSISALDTVLNSDIVPNVSTSALGTVLNSDIVPNVSTSALGTVLNSDIVPNVSISALDTVLNSDIVPNVSTSALGTVLNSDIVPNVSTSALGTVLNTDIVPNVSTSALGTVLNTDIVPNVSLSFVTTLIKLTHSSYATASNADKNISSLNANTSTIIHTPSVNTSLYAQQSVIKPLTTSFITNTDISKTVQKNTLVHQSKSLLASNMISRDVAISSIVVQNNSLVTSLANSSSITTSPIFTSEYNSSVSSIKTNTLQLIITSSKSDLKIDISSSPGHNRSTLFLTAPSTNILSSLDKTTANSAEGFSNLDSISKILYSSGKPTSHTFQPIPVYTSSLGRFVTTGVATSSLTRFGTTGVATSSLTWFGTTGVATSSFAWFETTEVATSSLTRFGTTGVATSSLTRFGTTEVATSSLTRFGTTGVSTSSLIRFGTTGVATITETGLNKSKTDQTAMIGNTITRIALGSASLTLTSLQQSIALSSSVLSQGKTVINAQATFMGDCQFIISNATLKEEFKVSFTIFLTSNFLLSTSQITYPDNPFSCGSIILKYTVTSDIPLQTIETKIQEAIESNKANISVGGQVYRIKFISSQQVAETKKEKKIWIYIVIVLVVVLVLIIPIVLIILYKKQRTTGKFDMSASRNYEMGAFQSLHIGTTIYEQQTVINQSLRDVDDEIDADLSPYSNHWSIPSIDIMEASYTNEHIDTDDER